MRWNTGLAVLLCALVIVATAAGALVLTRSLAAAGTGTLAGLQATAPPTPPAPAGGTSTALPAGVTAPSSDSAAASADAVGPDGGTAGSTGPAAAPVVTVPALTRQPATDPPPPPNPAATDAGPPVADAATAATTEPPPAAEGPTPAATPPPVVEVPVVPPYSTVLGWHGDQRVAYLTFDDGPAPATGRILDVLAGAGVSATFCMIGSRVAENPDLARRVVAAGHTACNHSWDHPSPFDALSAADLDQQIGRTQDAIAQATGVRARYFRAPEGRFGDTGGPVLQAGQRAGTIPLGWGVDSLDWKRPGAPAIVAGVLGAVSPGAVILLHDGGGTDREETIAALPGIIAGLQAAGYTLSALPPDPVG